MESSWKACRNKDGFLKQAKHQDHSQPLTPGGQDNISSTFFFSVFSFISSQIFFIFVLILVFRWASRTPGKVLGMLPPNINPKGCSKRHWTGKFNTFRQPPTHSHDEKLELPEIISQKFPHFEMKDEMKCTEKNFNDQDCLN